MENQKEIIEQKVRDINNVEFGDSHEDVSSSLLIVLTLFEADDDPEVIKACKLKLYEGIALLKKHGEGSKASEIEKEVKGK